MVDLMGLLSDALIGSFQMLMLNDLGKNMFPYRIKTCWKRILIYGVTALVILGVNHIESTFINIMMVPVSYTIAAIVIFQGSVWKKIILACCYYMLAIVPEFLFAVITGAYGVTGTENNFHSELEKLLSLLLMSTITFLLVKCVNQITRKKNYQTIENKLFTVLLTLPAATIIIFMCIYYSHISCNENELCMFMANCDVVINCAGASFINGEKIARTAAKMKIPLVDPSGESFLEERIKDIQKDNVFVLSSGCFPGMTGVLLNFLCSQFDDVKSLSGMSISTEIPSQSAIEDFILTNIAGFGQPLKYYNNGEYVRDEQIFYEIVRNSEFKLQNYYTVELERVVKKYRPEKANWYNVLFAEEIMKKMQEAVVQFSARGYSDEFRRIVAEIKKIFADNVKNNEAFNFLKVEANGTKNGSVTGRKIEILNDSSSQISALIASHASIELLNKKIVPGIYYATDIIEGDIVLGDLPKLNIDLNISEYVMQEESFDDEFEEGTI